MEAYIITATKLNTAKQDVLYLGFPAGKINFIRNAAESRVFTSRRLAETAMAEAKKQLPHDDRIIEVQRL